MDLKFILLESILGLITVIGLYIAIALTVFRIRLTKHAREIHLATPRNGWQLTEVQNQTNPDRISEEVMQESVGVMSYHSTALRRLCLISAWLVLLRYISDHIIFYFGLNDANVPCEIAIKISYLFFVLPFVVQYVFLWVRQKILYFHPVLKMSISQVIYAVGWSIPVLLIVGVAAVSALFIVDQKYIRLYEKLNLTEVETSNETNACVYLQGDVLPNIKLPWIVLAIFTLIFQILFILMYARPLVGQRTSVQILEMMNNTSNDSLYPIIKRLLLLTGGCFASDIAVFVAAFATEDVFISNLLLDFDLLVNLVCIVLTHLDWKQRLFPCRGNKNNRVEELTDTSATVSHCEIHRTTKEISSSRSPISSTSTTVEDVFE